MDQSTTANMLQRLGRLERENRRLKISGAILLLALAAVGAMGQGLPKAVPKVVEAERFVLRDTRGKILATLGTEAAGLLALVLSDQNGKTRAGLGVGTSGPSLVLRDENSKDRAALGHTALEGTATGTVEQRPASSLVLFDRDGKVIWKAP